MRAETDIPRPVIFKHCVPPKPLSDFVNLFWYWAGHSQAHWRERILPLNTVELIINLTLPRTSDSGISGPRVERFYGVIRAIEHQDDVDWADIAISSGYTDQPHFIHDFREFSGLRPTEYLGLRTGHLSHV